LCLIERERETNLLLQYALKNMVDIAEAKVQFHGNSHGVRKLTPIKVAKGLRTNKNDN
jgi:hypothetical protein